VWASVPAAIRASSPEPGGHQGQQPGKGGRQARDAGQAEHVRGPLSTEDERVRQALDVLGDGGEPGVAADAGGEAHQERQSAPLPSGARIDPQIAFHRKDGSLPEARREVGGGRDNDRSHDPHADRLRVPSGLVEHKVDGPADRRVGGPYGRCAERNLVAGCWRNPGRDHHLSRSRAV
jgi:hypothetical protein